MHLFIGPEGTVLSEVDSGLPWFGLNPQHGCLRVHVHLQAHRHLLLRPGVYRNGALVFEASTFPSPLRL